MRHGNISIFVAHQGCPHHCAFCNQHSITGVSGEMPTKEKVSEICRQALSEVKEPYNYQIAFFGGSFTAINRADMISLLQVASQYVGEGMFSGIRISTRPDCISWEILETLKNYKVTVIELGAQSMDDSVLLLNERGHTAADVVTSSKMIHQAGFELGLQMMTGLYGSTFENDFKTALSIADLNPSQVRVYPTCILKNTTLGKLYESGKYQSYTLDETVELCVKILEMFESRCIPVIKLGLHASELVEQQLLGEGYHPSFRELCESRIFRNRLIPELSGHKNTGLIVKVARGRLSQAIGQKKSNLKYFESIGYKLKFTECDKLSGYEIKIEEVIVCT